jgi:hypothetical protein
MIHEIKCSDESMILDFYKPTDAQDNLWEPGTLLTGGRHWMCTQTSGHTVNILRRVLNSRVVGKELHINTSHASYKVFIHLICKQVMLIRKI